MMKKEALVETKTGETAESLKRVALKQARAGLAEEVQGEKSKLVTREYIVELTRAKESNPETLKHLKGLDINKSGPEQEQEWRTLQAIISCLLARLYQHNAQRDLGSLRDFPRLIQEGRRYIPVDAATLISFFRQIEAAPSSPLRRDLEAVWPQLLDLAANVARELPKIEGMEKNGWDKPIPIYERPLKWLQEHPTARKIAIVAGALGAAFFIGKLIFSGGKKKGMIGRILGGAAVVGTVAAFSYGYLKREKSGWLEWLTQWFEKEQKEPAFEKLSKRINIPPETLQKLGKESYGKFMKGNLEGDSGWGWVGTKASEGLGFEKAPTGFGQQTIFGIPLPFSGISLAEANKVRNFLANTIKKNEIAGALQRNGVNLKDEKTTLASVFAVLNDLEKNGSLEEALEPATENPDNNPDEDVAVETAPDSALAVGAKTYKHVTELVKNDAPRITDVLEKWKKRGFKDIIFNSGDFAKDLVLAAEKTEKVSLLISATQIIIWNAGRYVILASGGALVETFKKAAEAVFMDKVNKGDVWDTYKNHAYEFIVIGGVIGFFRGAKVSGNIGLIPQGMLGRIPGALRGSLKGAIFPFTTAYRISRAGAFIYHEAQELPWRFKRVFSGAEAHAQYWGEQARIEAEAYRRWYKWHEYRIGALRDPIKSPLAQHFLPEDIEKNLRRYGSRFSNAYNRFTLIYNEAFDQAIKGGTKRSLERLTFNPSIDARFEQMRELIDREFPETKAGILRAATTFEEALEAEKLRIDPKETKLAKYWSKLATFIGPVAAGHTIYYLETADDKKKAIAETALGYAGFISGVTVMERTVAKAIKNPLWHGFFVTLGGIGGAMGFTGGLENIVNDYFIRFPGAYKASEEVANILELASGGYLARRGLAFAAHMAPKALEGMATKVGLKTLEEALTKKLLTSAFIKNIGAVVSRIGLGTLAKKLGVKLGQRGAILVAGHAIPGLNMLAVATDVVLLPFFAKDMYDIVAAIGNARQLNELMHERRNHAFTNVEILEPPEAKIAFESQRDDFLKKGEKDILAFFENIPAAKLRIIRQDSPGNEIWTLRRGVLEGLAIYDEHNKEIVSLQSKDVSGIAEKGLQKAA